MAPVLADHPELHVATKAGFLTAQAACAAGVIPAAQVRHSIAAEFVRWQTARSRTELGRQRLDAVFLHNPERHRRGDRRHLAGALRAAFAVLEEAAHAKEIAAYGVATWNGFTQNAFTVPLLDQLAREAAGNQRTPAARPAVARQPDHGHSPRRSHERSRADTASG
nr:hypothetical protein [Streptomyces sp. 3214.6]